MANNDTSSITTEYDDMATSICPAGWRLPTGRQTNDDPLEGNELGTMIYSYDIAGELQNCGGTCTYANYLEGGFNAIRTAPLWLARSGLVYSGSLKYTGSDGSYWSSTVSSTVYGNSGAYDLELGYGGVGLSRSSSRHYGYSIRCVAE